MRIWFFITQRNRYQRKGILLAKAAGIVDGANNTKLKIFQFLFCICYNSAKDWRCSLYENEVNRANRQNKYRIKVLRCCRAAGKCNCRNVKPHIRMVFYFCPQSNRIARHNDSKTYCCNRYIELSVFLSEVSVNKHMQHKTVERRYFKGFMEIGIFNIPTYITPHRIAKHGAHFCFRCTSGQFLFVVLVRFFFFTFLQIGDGRFGRIRLPKVRNKCADLNLPAYRYRNHPLNCLNPQTTEFRHERVMLILSIIILCLCADSIKRKYTFFLKKATACGRDREAVYRAAALYLQLR